MLSLPFLRRPRTRPAPVDTYPADAAWPVTLQRSIHEAPTVLIPCVDLSTPLYAAVLRERGRS